MERRSKQKIPTLRIYTDGATRQIGNSGRGYGAWAFYAVRDANYIYYASEGYANTTNQRQELLAIIKGCEWALRNRTKNEIVEVFSDSAYAINGIRQRWYEKWRRNGWKNSEGKDVANRDLWEQLVPFCDHFMFRFFKVKGHEETYYNIKADELAVKTREEFEKNWSGVKENG